SGQSFEFTSTDFRNHPDGDFVIAGNGNIIATGAGSVVVMNPQGETVAESVGFDLFSVTGLAKAPDGRILGAATKSQSSVVIVEIDPGTAAISELKRFDSPGNQNNIARIAATEHGYYISEHTSSANYRLFYVDRVSYTVTEIPLPEGLRIESYTRLDTDPAGSLYLLTADRRVGIAIGIDVVLKMDPQTFEFEVVA